MLNKLAGLLFSTLLIIAVSSAANAQTTPKTKVVVVPLFDSPPEPEPEPEPVKIVFVSNAQPNGNIGGPEAADNLCQVEADADDSLVQGKSFKAWISNGLATNFNGTGRVFIRSQVPYQLTNGTRIADNFQDLIANFPDAPINITASGNIIGTIVRTEVWTGVLGSGAFTEPDCANWTSNSLRADGRRGSTRASQDEDWTSLRNVGCDGRARLYCFEQ